MNVHLDHVNRNAHLPCVKVLLDEEEKLINKYNDIKFVFIGGCFYCEENDEEINYIKMKGFNEIKFENTYHGFTGNALAIAILCFCPPDNFDPLSPTIVFKPKGNIFLSKIKSA